MNDFFYGKLLTECVDKGLNDKLKETITQGRVENSKIVSLKYSASSLHPRVEKEIYQSDIKDFLVDNKTLATQIIDKFMILFALREQSIQASFIDPKVIESNRKILGNSKFCDSSFFIDLTGSKFDTCKQKLGHLFNFTLIFIPCYHDNCWSLLVVDDINDASKSVSVSYINPSDGLKDTEDSQPLAVSQDDHIYLNALCNFLRNQYDDIQVNNKVYTRMSNLLPVIRRENIAASRNNSDTGLIVLLVITFIYNKCNIFIKLNEIGNIRVKFALALIAGKFNTFN